MTTPKQHVQNLLDDLPDDVSWEELRLEVNEMETTLLAFDECDRGECVPHEQVVKEFESWVAKFRRTRRSTKNAKPSRRLKNRRHA